MQHGPIVPREIGRRDGRQPSAIDPHRDEAAPVQHRHGRAADDWRQGLRDGIPPNDGLIGHCACCRGWRSGQGASFVRSACSSSVAGRTRALTGGMGYVHGPTVGHPCPPVGALANTCHANEPLKTSRSHLMESRNSWCIRAGDRGLVDRGSVFGCVPAPGHTAASYAMRRARASHKEWCREMGASISAAK